MEQMSQGELFGPDHPVIEPDQPQDVVARPKSISEELPDDVWDELNKKDPERYTDY